MNRLPAFLYSPQFVLILSALVVLVLFNTSLKHKLQPQEIKELLNGSCIKDCLQNPLLINHIMSTMIKPSGTSPVLEFPEGIKSKGQKNQVDRILQHFNNKKNGFFIEAGAWDGEQLSNTIFLETQLGWTGLLVEPNKGAFDLLVTKKRNSYSINSCLATRGYAEKVKFDTANLLGKIAIDDDPNKEAKENDILYFENSPEFQHKEIARETVTVQCFPLYSILLALGNPRVDFLSLDIEGSEMDVLRTIPFDKIDIELLLIETNQSNITAMIALMSNAGYEATEVPPFDHMFVKKLVN